MNQLRDVSPTDWSYEALRYLADGYGIIYPYKDKTFRGNLPMTKAEIIALEAHAFSQFYKSINQVKESNLCINKQEITLNEIALTRDVYSSDWYYKSYKTIACITDNKYLDTDGLFHGEETVKRGEMVIFINRFINGSERFIINVFLNNNSTSQGIYDFNNNQYLDLSNNNNLAKITNVNQFRDVNSTDWFYKDLKSLVERFGSLSGYSDQTFQAYKPASRYEIAVLIRYSLSHLNRLLRLEKHNCRNYSL
ncbi:MAG: S-layer homology domain-containing protein [Xenococcaceae cyanobacterium MO_167.B27]|nr:S-layer homology domain-containing protein [Xenococcaceae cyanobacterium MO_167.B27]